MSEENSLKAPRVESEASIPLKLPNELVVSGQPKQLVFDNVSEEEGEKEKKEGGEEGRAVKDTEGEHLTVKKMGVDINSAMQREVVKSDEVLEKDERKKGSGRRFKRQPRKSKDREAAVSDLLGDDKKRLREEPSDMVIDEGKKGKMGKVTDGVTVVVKAGPADRSCNEQ